jgi:hypothetical protein
MRHGAPFPSQGALSSLLPLLRSPLFVRAWKQQEYPENAKTDIFESSPWDNVAPPARR